MLGDDYFSRVYHHEYLSWYNKRHIGNVYKNMILIFVTQLGTNFSMMPLHRQIGASK